MLLIYNSFLHNVLFLFFSQIGQKYFVSRLRFCGVCEQMHHQSFVIDHIKRKILNALTLIKKIASKFIHGKKSI